MRNHWSYRLSMFMLGIIVVMIAASFLVEQILNASTYQAEVFYHSTFFMIVLVITTFVYSIFLVMYLKSLFHSKKKDAFGLALLHIGVLFFLMFGIFHSIDYFYQEKTMMIQDEKLYEIGDGSYIQWRVNEQLLAIIQKEEEQFVVVKKIPIYTDRISKWNHIQFQEIYSEKNLQSWEILQEDQQVIKINFVGQEVEIDNERFELIEFFTDYALDGERVINQSEQLVKPAIVLYDKKNNQNVWISEEHIYGLEGAKLTKKTYDQTIGLLIVHMRLMPIFVLAASCFSLGYLLFIINNWRKKKVQNELVIRSK